MLWEPLYSAPKAAIRLLKFSNKQAPRVLIILSTQLTFHCLKSTIETIEKGVKYVQS